LARLPKTIQDLAQKSFSLWEGDTSHPGLNFELIDEEDRIWSARVGLHHRALCYEDSGDYVWYWIGTHAEYDRLIG
jgi:hypothetical protein